MSKMAAPGSLLPGGFVLGRLSHADRVGLVYRAHHAENREARAAAALVLHPLHVDALRGWFEAMSVLNRSLRHPNLVEVLALGYTGNDLPVLVSEWVEGRTARHELSNGRAFPPAEVSRIVREVASALDYLHRRTPAVLHRVIMPESVLLTSPAGHVKLLSVGHADRPLYPASKPSYLSPEELSGEGALSPASDVFPMASLAYELLTGQIAFPGASPAILASVYRAQLPRLGAVEGAAEVEAVLHRAWQADPARRFQSAGAFSDALSGALADLTGTVSAARRSAPADAVSSTPPAAASDTGRFAAATFHADALRSPRRNGSSRGAVWSVPPSPGSHAPLLAQSPAVPMNTSLRASGVQPALAQTPGIVPGALDVAPANEAPREPDDDAIMGRLDAELHRGARLTDDEFTVTNVSPATRKEPLFVPASAAVPTPPRSRPSGEFPPAARSRASGEFPPARMTGEFPPAPRPTGEFPPAPRPSGEFPPAPRPTGEFAAARLSGEFTAAPRETTPKAVEATPPETTPAVADAPSAKPTEAPVTKPDATEPTRKATLSRPSRAALPATSSPPSDRPPPPPRSVFERDAFAPAPERPETPSQPASSRAVKFTWPVVLGLAAGQSVLTAGLVAAILSVLPARAPQVVYLPPVNATAPAPSTALPDVTATLPPTLPVEPLAPVTDASPLASADVTPAADPAALAPSPNEAPPVIAAPAPVIAAPVAPVVAAPVAPVIAAPVARPRPRPRGPVVLPPFRADPLARTAPPAPVAAPAAPAPAPTPAPAPAPRPAGGFGEPPPNPY